jgi:predicted RNase H-like nuclease (RuvC/YqgF family)
MPPVQRYTIPEKLAIIKELAEEKERANKEAARANNLEKRLGGSTSVIERLKEDLMETKTRLGEWGCGLGRTTLQQRSAPACGSHRVRVVRSGQ